jgi:hypothetical protein
MMRITRVTDWGEFAGRSSLDMKSDSRLGAVRAAYRNAVPASLHPKGG